MSLAYHRRLKFRRTALESARLCLAWFALLVCDFALFAIGHEWDSIRRESARIWR